MLRPVMGGDFLRTFPRVNHGSNKPPPAISRNLSASQRISAREIMQIEVLRREQGMRFSMKMSRSRAMPE
jgi:hypothetical protein